MVATEELALVYARYKNVCAMCANKQCEFREPYDRIRVLDCTEWKPEWKETH